MKRMLVQLDEETYQKLRQRAFREQRSISSVVRQIVGDHLEGHPVRRASRVRDFASVGAGRSRQQGLAPVSERHDEALAAAFRK